MNKTFTCILILMLWWSGCTPAAAAAGPEPLTVSGAVGIALENNPAVEKAAADREGAGYARQSALAGFLPNVSADYTVTALNDAPYMITAGHAVQVAHDTLYEWGVSIVQPLFTGMALTSQYKMAKLQEAIQEKAAQQTVLEITHGVKSACYRLLLGKKIAVVADEAVATLASHDKEAKMFFDHGIIRRNDLLRAEVALADAVQSREKARAGVAVARADLNRRLARDINAPTQIADIEQVTPVHFQLAELLEQGLQTRPQLQAMALVRQTLAQAVTLEKSAYYPEVAAVGRYWQSGDTPGADNNDYENDHNAALMIKATWTLFDANKTRAKVARAQSAQRAYEATIRQAEDGVRLEIKSAWLNLDVAEKNIDLSRAALAQAEENLRITRLGYRQEAATSTEVLDARTDLTRAKTNYYQALYGYLDALAALERAIGQGPATGGAPRDSK